MERKAQRVIILRWDCLTSVPHRGASGGSHITVKRLGGHNHIRVAASAISGISCLVCFEQTVGTNARGVSLEGHPCNNEMIGDAR